MNNIDVVILWVDGNESKWQKQYKLYKEIYTGDSNINRFEDWDTLRFLFRGIEMYMPWVNKIHLVTCNQSPSWLKHEHSKVNFVNHDDIFLNKEDLPTFNASAIELCIANIESLAEQFIYFNDDCLLFKDVPVERYFSNGLPTDFLVQSVPRHGFVYDLFFNRDSWPLMIKNCIDLINVNNDKKELLKFEPSIFYNSNYSILDRCSNYFWNKVSKKYCSLKHYHHAIPYLKSQMERVNKLYDINITQTRTSKFRKPTDITQYIYRYDRLTMGEFSPIDYFDYSSISIIDEKSAEIAIKLFSEKRFVCVNDSLPENLDCRERIKETVIKELYIKFPNKSSFEK